MVRTHTYWLSIDDYIDKCNTSTYSPSVKYSSSIVTRTKIYFEDE